ncbi:hypothetical protein [Parasitella parasitica]|uniref:Uncharacterized protein n=1 Tax=Parasitella parasitica TaxID=35722 RepID=A0A0B7MNZ0_9FUNG|nr:hypothetical protein [Parasitella parasitica]
MCGATYNMPSNLKYNPSLLQSSPLNDIRLKRCQWKKYLTDEEIDDIEKFKMKQLVELPLNVNEYIESLQKCTDAVSLKRQLSQELECPASEWIRNRVFKVV